MLVGEWYNYNYGECNFDPNTKAVFEGSDFTLFTSIETGAEIFENYYIEYFRIDDSLFNPYPDIYLYFYLGGRDIDYSCNISIIGNDFKNWYNFNYKEDNFLYERKASFRIKDDSGAEKEQFMKLTEALQLFGDLYIKKISMTDTPVLSFELSRNKK